MERGLLHGGIATAIGSLPHPNAPSASAFVLRTLPDLPAAPQLPRRSALEGMLAQWLRALPEVLVHDDGTLELATTTPVHDAPVAEFCRLAHGGLLGFVELVAAQPRRPRAVKVQLTGPLTLGAELVRIGMPTERAYERAAQCVRAWARALTELVEHRLPDVGLVMFFDEPALVGFAADEPPIDVEYASDLLSGCLAAAGDDVVTGVHVCGGGEIEIALAAGPSVVAIDVHPRWLDHAVALSRFLDGGGFIAWGAVPTDRPIGEQPGPLWKNLVGLWCDLTKRGCDPVRLRQQALVTPACGLALHGPTQAERALQLTRELADRVFDQAAATRLSIGA